MEKERDTVEMAFGVVLGAKAGRAACARAGDFYAERTTRRVPLTLADIAGAVRVITDRFVLETETYDQLQYSHKFAMVKRAAPSARAASCRGGTRRGWGGRVIGIAEAVLDCLGDATTAATMGCAPRVRAADSSAERFAHRLLIALDARRERKGDSVVLAPSGEAPCE